MKFPLTRLTASQPPKDKLPFALSRPLGQGDETPIVPTIPIAPKNPFGTTIGNEWTVSIGKAVAVASCYSIAQAPISAIGCLVVRFGASAKIANCQSIKIKPFDNLWACRSIGTIPPLPMMACMGVAVRVNAFVYQCVKNNLTNTINFRHCTAITGAKTERLTACQSLPLSHLVKYGSCVRFWQKSAFVYACQAHTLQPATPVPCRFYPIPEPPPPPSERACPLPPPSDRLPFRLTRRARVLDNYPFRLKCWNDDEPIITDSTKGILVYNTITAHIAGKKIDPLSFSIKTDMNSFCWQGQVELVLPIEIDDNPLISININGLLFVIMAEELTHNRSFGKNSVTVSGRSVTAQLSSDYGKSKAISETLYASQMVNSQLENLAITANYELKDYLVQAGVYTGNGKSLIAVIDEIAKAGGGFVYSDPSEGVLYLKKRYKVPAWELATATPDKVVGLDRITSMTTAHRQNPRYNSVWLVGQIGGQVYRQGQDRTADAPSSDNALYNDPAIIDAGIAILSDSGNHKTLTVNTILADKYQMGLAQLGEIWQLDNQNAIVTGVSIDVKSDNGVPVVSQTVTLDGYEDV